MFCQNWIFGQKFDFSNSVHISVIFFLPWFFKSFEYTQALSVCNGWWHTTISQNFKKYFLVFFFSFFLRLSSHFHYRIWTTTASENLFWKLSWTQFIHRQLLAFWPHEGASIPSKFDRQTFQSYVRGMLSAQSSVFDVFFMLILQQIFLLAKL